MFPVDFSGATGADQDERALRALRDGRDHPERAQDFHVGPGVDTSSPSRRNRYFIPSMTVGVLSEMLRPVPVLIRNPDCEGGDILTIWLRQATSVDAAFGSMYGSARRRPTHRLKGAKG